MIPDFFPPILAVFFGAMLGSFTTMLIHRLHYDEKGIFTGRSQCPSCHHILGAKNLVPIFSWLFQKGKCAFCQSKISPFYPMVEITFVVVYVLFTFKFLGTDDFWPIMISILFILILFFYDARFFEVDRRVSFPAILLALVWVFFREAPVSDYLFGGGLGFSFYALLYFGSRGRWVGAGDMELGLFMGLLLGWQQFILALFFANILGLFYALPLLILKKADMKTALPMGAFLMPATLFFLYFGEEIWQAYLRLLGIV